MPEKSQLDQEGQALRRAVSHRDFAAAEKSAIRYRALIDQLPPAARGASLPGACQLFSWAGRNMRIARARIADNLRRTQVAARYLAG